MFKLVVLCAFLAAAVAEPGVLLGAPLAAPLAYSSTVYSPATTTISQQASSVVHPSPYYAYNAPLAYSHFIKKRSAALAFGGYYAPTSYIASAPLAAAAYTAPLIAKAPYYAAPALAYSTPAHFIKKRSVALALPSTYIAPATYPIAASPVTSTYIAAAQVPQVSPYIATAPIGYSHFIKKRSAPVLASALLAPTSYSTQSRVDVQHSAPLYTSYSAPLAYASPLAYSSPLAYTRLY